MSASAPRNTGMRNPAQLFIKWKGGDEQGWFEYYDKEQGKNFQIDLSKGFWILDKDLFSITGYNEPENMTIISNAVRGITDDLIVKGYKDKKATLLLKGTYENLKPQIKDIRHYNYTRDAYIMLPDGRLAHLGLSGAAFAAWIKDVESNSAHQNHIIQHTGTESGKKGNVKYKFPAFTVGKKATDKQWEQICKLDSEVLQPYLEQYLVKKATSTDEHSQEERFDQANWRQYKMPNGSRLCEFTIEQLREASDTMAGNGDVDCPAFDCINQALIDFRAASEQWKDKKDKGGKSLEDYTLEELVETIKRVPVDHPSMIFLMAAKDEKENAVDSLPFEDEEDIPF